MRLEPALQLRILTAYVLSLNFFCTAGVIYGWSGLYTQLFREGQFRERCDDTSQSCSEQRYQLDLIPAIAFPFATVSTVVHGILVDRYGSWKNAFAGAVIFTFGMILLAVSNSDSVNAFIPAYIFIGWGGIAVFLPSFQLAPLYKERQTLFRAGVNAAFTCAAILFSFVDFLYTYGGFLRHTSLSIWATIAALYAVTLPFMFPNRPYQDGDVINLRLNEWLNGHFTWDDAKADNTGDVVTNADSLPLDISDSSDGSSEKRNGHAYKAASDYESPKHSDKSRTGDESSGSVSADSGDAVKDSKSLYASMKEPLLIGLAIYFGVGLLYSNWINATIAPQLTKMGDHDGWWAFVFICMASFLPIPTAFLVDYVIRRFQYSGAMMVSIVLLSASYVPLFIAVLGIQIITFLLYLISRAFIVTTMFSFVAVAYRIDHYGRLIAFVNTIAAAIGFVQMGMSNVTEFSFGQNYNYVNGWCMLTALFLLIYAVYMRSKNH